MKIFLDSSDINEIKASINNPLIQGYTTNPSLTRKAGVIDYEKFAKEVLQIVKDKPVSFEVLADDFAEMERQARIISSWGKQIYIKIPITNTKGESSNELIKRLLLRGIKLNITAITTTNQIMKVTYHRIIPMIFSIFSGRIADTGVNPSRTFKNILDSHFGISKHNVKFLWASCREVFNIYQAEAIGADIITCSPEIIAKYEKMKGKDLDELSLETVKQFYEDGQAAGYKI